MIPTDVNVLIYEALAKPPYEHGVEGPTPSISVKTGGLFVGGLRSLATAGGFARASYAFRKDTVDHERYARFNGLQWRHPLS